MKKTGAGIKEIINLNKNGKSQVSQLQYRGENINDNETMANTFNDFFTKIGTELDKEIPTINSNRDFYLKSRVPNSFLITPTDPQEIQLIIKDLNDTKSPGP